MATLNIIVQLADAAGTSITIKPPATYKEVITEFEQAWAEQRLMNVNMEQEGYKYRVNPQQVVYIRQLKF